MKKKKEMKGMTKQTKYAGTQTEKNLETAFAGESQARNKYTYFASVAKKQGFEQIAALFLKTADNEKEHAKMWFKELGGIGDTVDHVHGTARQVEQHDADAPVTAQLERTRGKVGSKPERLHGRMNLIACRLSHAIGLVNHARNRLERNTSGNRHIIH